MLFQALAGREGCTTLPALISMARAPFISAVRNGVQENVAGHKLRPFWCKKMPLLISRKGNLPSVSHLFISKLVKIHGLYENIWRMYSSTYSAFKNVSLKTGNNNTAFPKVPTLQCSSLLEMLEAVSTKHAWKWLTWWMTNWARDWQQEQCAKAEWDPSAFASSPVFPAAPCRKAPHAPKGIQEPQQLFSKRLLEMQACKPLSASSVQRTWGVRLNLLKSTQRLTETDGGPRPAFTMCERKGLQNGNSLININASTQVL